MPFLTSKKECPICEKQVVKLARHLKLKHHIHPSNKLIPRNLKDFVAMIVLFPISPAHWKLICQQRESVIEYLENDTPLPHDIFSILYQALEQYKEPQSNCYRLALLKLSEVNSNISHS